MRFKSLKLVLAVFVIAGLAGAPSALGQGLVDGIRVTLPAPVTLGEKILDPGEYEIRRVSHHVDNVLKIFSNDKMVYETNVIMVPTHRMEFPEDSKVVLHRIGNRYYFDKIWIQGRSFGYEFVLPDEVEALKRDLAD
jgi:hypothetical protein